MSELVSKYGAKFPISVKSKRIKQLRQIAEPLEESHIYNAAAKLDNSISEVSSFKDSTNFDVIINANRYPPKAILGTALADYHGVKILPEHFTGGEKSSCFGILRDLGFEIVEKNSVKKKLKREDETFSYSAFEIGELNTKLEVYERAGVWVPNQGRDIPGVIRFKNCVVLFVTLEKSGKELRHKYKDKFLLGGKMFQWESQNMNTPNTPHMKKIINGEPVVLFARLLEKVKNKSQPFTYIGSLDYINYNYPVDSNDNPVEVLFDVKEHQNEPTDYLSSLYNWSPGDEQEDANIDLSKTTLNRTSPPIKPRQAKNQKKPKSHSKVNWAERDEHNRNLGLVGEKLVFDYEVRKLENLGLNHLAKKVEHIAENTDSAGYDILSFDENGVEMFIEVKTTRQSKGTSFFISRNEVEVSREKEEQYWIYRVYGLKDNSDRISFYSLNGPVDRHFDLIPESFKASPK